MINRSESQLIAREARNQVLKANRRSSTTKPARRPPAETRDANGPGPSDTAEPDQK